MCHKPFKMIGFNYGGCVVDADMIGNHVPIFKGVFMVTFAIKKWFCGEQHINNVVGEQMPLSFVVKKM